MQRFELAVDECRQLGENFQEDKLLARFMDGLDSKSKIYEARIEVLCSAKNMAELNPSFTPITLDYVQSQLLAIDEARGLTNQNTGVRRYNSGNPYAMPATMNPNYHRKSKTRLIRKAKPGYKSCKYCGKIGHTIEECRKQKQDEDSKGKAGNRPDNQQHTKTNFKGHVRCYKCNKLGHYANKCPNDATPQQAHRATVDTKISRNVISPTDRETSPNNDLQEMIMMAIHDPPNRWNARPCCPVFANITGFRGFLPDSGATSHFVSNLDDLNDPTPCDMEVTIADGTKVRATHVGQAEINFTSDSGTPSTLVLAHVYYIPGLSR
jgi:hypothetical protein